MEHLITSIACDEKKAILFTLGTLTYGFWILLRNELYSHRNKNKQIYFIENVFG